MGHLAIVNDHTLQDVLRTGRVSTTGRLGKHWVKTLADLMADLLVTRPGDPVFPWIVADEHAGTPNRGFSHELEVAGPPVLVPGDPYPLKLPLRPAGTRWDPPLQEADAVDLFGGGILWNAIGKKALQRGRSFTHQTPPEDELLRNMLDDRTGVTRHSISVGSSIPASAIPLTINAAQTGGSHLSAPSHLNAVSLGTVQWVAGSRFVNEKTLEAWLVERLDGPSLVPFWNLALGARGPLTWFGNYLPFGVAGGNVDLVALHERGDDPSELTCTVVELKVGGLSANGFRWAARQALDYARFLQRALAAFGLTVVMNAVVLSGPSTPRGLTHLTPPAKTIMGQAVTVKWITYEVQPGGVVAFQRLK